MQRPAKKVNTAIIILLMVLLFCGCGSEDLLDETGQRYRAEVIFSDGPSDSTLDVDVQQSACGGEGEEFTDLHANLTITVGPNEPAITLTGYKITFIPLASYDQFNNEYFGPSVNPYIHAASQFIPSNSEYEFSILCMEADVKIWIGDNLPDCELVGDPCTDFVYIYRVDIRLDFEDEYGEPRVITVTETLNFGMYNNC